MNDISCQELDPVVAFTSVVIASFTFLSSGRLLSADQRTLKYTSRGSPCPIKRASKMLLYCHSIINVDFTNIISNYVQIAKNGYISEMLTRDRVLIRFCSDK